MTFLLLRLKDVWYRVLPLTPEDGTWAAWCLRRKSGKEYTVSQDRHGIACTCADYVYRRHNTPLPCKHGQALKEMGLFPLKGPR